RHAIGRVLVKGVSPCRQPPCPYCRSVPLPRPGRYRPVAASSRCCAGSGDGTIATGSASTLPRSTTGCSGTSALPAAWRSASAASRHGAESWHGGAPKRFVPRRSLIEKRRRHDDHLLHPLRDRSFPEGGFRGVCPQLGRGDPTL